MGIHGARLERRKLATALMIMASFVWALLPGVATP
jgi:hypothetical protein